METLKRIINNEKPGYVIDCFGTTAPMLQKLRYNNIGGYTSLVSIDSIRFIFKECQEKGGIVYVNKNDLQELIKLYPEIGCLSEKVVTKFIEPVNMTENNMGDFVKLSERHEEEYDITYVPFTAKVYDTTILPDTIKIGRFFNTMAEGKAVLKPEVGLPIMVYGDLPLSTSAYLNNNFDFKYFCNQSKDDIITMFEGTKKYRDIIGEMMKSEEIESNDSDLFISLILNGCYKTQAMDFVNRVKFIEDNNLKDDYPIIKKVYESVCKGRPLRVVDISSYSIEEVEEIIYSAKINNILLITISNGEIVKHFEGKYLHVITTQDKDRLHNAGINNHLENCIGYVSTNSKLIEFIIQ